MAFTPIQQFRAGIEISPEYAYVAKASSRKNQVHIKHLSRVKIPTGILRPSFKNQNVIDENALTECLNNLKKDLKLSKASVALPDSSVKIMIKVYKELPQSDQAVQEMIIWDSSNQLGIPPEDLRCAWEYMGKTPDGSHALVVVSCLDTVIQQYESCLSRSGLKETIILPAGLSQFNFYAHLLPESGRFAYLGLFDAYITIFVFSNGLPVFYKTIRKGLLSGSVSSAIDDIDFLLQYYSSEFPDLELDQIFVASHIKSKLHIQEILQDTISGPFEMMYEKEMVEIKKNNKLSKEHQLLPFYTAALGAAVRR